MGKVETIESTGGRAKMRAARFVHIKVKNFKCKHTSTSSTNNESFSAFPSSPVFPFFLFFLFAVSPFVSPLRAAKTLSALQRRVVKQKTPKGIKMQQASALTDLRCTLSENDISIPDDSPASTPGNCKESSSDAYACSGSNHWKCEYMRRFFRITKEVGISTCKQRLQCDTLSLKDIPFACQAAVGLYRRRCYCHLTAKY